jgi:hypothetical protein
VTMKFPELFLRDLKGTMPLIPSKEMSVHVSGFNTDDVHY